MLEVRSCLHSSLPDAVHAGLCWLLPLGHRQSSRLSFAYCILRQELRAPTEQELSGLQMAEGVGC